MSMSVFLGHTASVCGVITSSIAGSGHLDLPLGPIWGNNQSMLSCTVFLSDGELAAMLPFPLMTVSIVHAFP